MSFSVENSNFVLFEKRLPSAFTLICKEKYKQQFGYSSNPFAMTWPLSRDELRIARPPNLDVESFQKTSGSAKCISRKLTTFNSIVKTNKHVFVLYFLSSRFRMYDSCAQCNVCNLMMDTRHSVRDLRDDHFLSSDWSVFPHPVLLLVNT